MIAVYSFVIIGLCFLAFFSTKWIFEINQARRKGLYPPKGKATMFDVRNLIIKGEKELAVRVYCDIFDTNYREAKRAVEDLLKSIHKNNSK